MTPDLPYPYRPCVSDDAPQPPPSPAPDAAPEADADALPPFVRGLLDVEAYPHAPSSVTLVQTHISYVWIAGEVVYKAKKPVNFGFIDQVAPEARERHCRLEVELNRRLAPDVYLGVVPIVQAADGSFAVDRPEVGGTVVEWAVKMRRLPDDRSLDRLLEAGEAPGDIGRRIALKLAEFHAAARVVEDDRAFAGAEAEQAWWGREVAEAEGNIGGTWRSEDAEALRAFVAESLAREAPLFDERLAQGRVVEGHGDLHAKHIYVLGPEPQDLVVVDCVEFTEWYHFRYLDRGFDLAFVAMDLEARGHRALGDEVAGYYIAATEDETLGVLQPLHRAWRAFIRGKVESIGANDPGIPEAERAALAASASHYFRLASTYAARRRAPVLVVLCGISGTGKSTVGGVLAARMGAALVSTDPVRRDVARARGLSTTMWQQYEATAYAPEMNREVYQEMRRRARAHLQAGRPVILDGTHRRVGDRQEALAIARDLGVPALVVELRLADDAALARVVDRERLQGGEPNPEAFRRHVEEFDPVTSVEGSVLALDAAQPPVDLAEQIEEELP